MNISFSSLIAVAVLTLVSCGPDKHTARISGTISGVDQAAFLIYAPTESPDDHGATDSIKLNRGAFSYDRPIDSPTVLTVVYPNYSTLTFVAVPGEEVHLSGEANRLKEVELSGGEDNELLQRFRVGNRGRSEGDVRRKAEAFIRSHPASPAALAVFLDFFARAEQPRRSPDAELLALLQKKQPTNPQISATFRRLSPTFSTAAGAKLPAFTATTLGGDRFSSDALRGKTAIIFFSASWDNGAFRYASVLSKLRRRFGARLVQVNLLFDGNREKARQRALRDSLSNAVFAEGEYENPLARKLGVRYLPGNILVRPDGTIAARDVDADRLENEVEKVIR